MLYVSAGFQKSGEKGELETAPQIRVQFDPDRVPRPHRSEKENSESFERSLEGAQRSLGSREETSESPERVDSRNPEVPEQLGTSPAPEAVPESNTPENAVQESQAHGENPVLAALQPEEPARASNRSDLSSVSGTNEKAVQGPRQDLPRVLQTEVGKGIDTTRAVLAHDPTGRGQELAARTNSPQSGTGRIGLESARGSRVTAASSRPATHRAYNAKALEMAAKTRESVFKKIVLEMTPKGGHMSVRLDPPQLGQLDVNMIVEKGAVVRLSLGAERSEVAQMLDKHLPELKQLLAEQGLTVEDAEVFTHNFGNEQNQGRPLRQNHQQGVPESELLETGPMHRTGYITTEGLDFWV